MTHLVPLLQVSVGDDMADAMGRVARDWPGTTRVGDDWPVADDSAARPGFLLCSDRAALGRRAKAAGHLWLGLARDAAEAAALRDAGADDVARADAHPTDIMTRLRLLGRLWEAQTCCASAEDLLTALAHDARLPLFSLLGYAGLLADGTLGPLAPEQAEAVQSIVGATGRIERLLADGLDMARSRAGALAPELAELDLRAPLAGAVGTLQGLARAARVEVVVDQPAEQVVVRGDAARLERAFTNVLANAIQHSPSGGQVNVVLATGQGVASVVVTDQGRGLDLADQPHLFERGYRTRAGTLVLGLSLVRELVELHGGRVLAGGEPGRGARFELQLPLPPA